MRRTEKTELAQALATADTALDELAKIDRIETEARAELDQMLARGAIDSEKDRTAFASASFRHQLCPANRRKVQAALRELESELPRLIVQARRDFNKKVAASRAVKLEELKAALRPFYGGNERQLKRDVEQLQAPALRAFEKLTAGFVFHENPTIQTKVDEARSLVAHTRRVSRQLGFQD